MAIRPSFLAWGIPRTEAPGGYSPCGRRESDIPESVGVNASINEGMPAIASELPEAGTETQAYSPPNPQKKPNLLLP